MSAIDDLTPVPDQPEISEGNQTFHQKAYALYKWMREKLAPAIIELRNLIINAVTGAFTSTSTTSFTIGTGDISITIGTGRSFVPGTSIRAAYVTDPTKYVDGIVKTYNSSTGALVFTAQTTSGAGTYANWSISIIASSGSFASLVANKFTGLQTLANEVTVASATTIDLTAAGSNQFKLTGTVQVEGATMPQGAVIKGRAAAATPLKNSATFVLQGGADYTCAAGDWLEFKKDTDGNIHVSITPFTGNPLRLKTPTNDSSFSSTGGNPISDDWLLGRVGTLRFKRTAWSSAYTPTAGELLEQAHGLSTVPFNVKLIRECVASNAGYVAGERISSHLIYNGGSSYFEGACFSDATNVGIKAASGHLISIFHKSTGALTIPADGCWKYCFEFSY